MLEATEEGAPFSKPTDVLSPRVALQEIPLKEAGQTLTIILQIYKESCGWRVLLLPGCSIINKTAFPLLVAQNSRVGQDKVPFTPHPEAL